MYKANKTNFLLSLLFLSLVPWAYCSYPDPGVPLGCTKDTDCGPPLRICVKGQCEYSVTTDMNGSAGCSDQAKNGSETDVDCGGGICTACGLGQVCVGNADCQSNNCAAGICRVGPGCADNMKNGNETDVDCGGNCVGCSDGKICTMNRDCISGNCSSNICISGPQILVDGLAQPYDLTIDATYIYWVENRAVGGALRKVPKVGGSATTLSAVLAEPTAVIVDANYAYVLERNNGANGRIDRIPLAGGSAEPVVGGLNNSQNHLVQAGSNLYWGDYVMGTGGVIKTAAKSAGAIASVVAQGNGLLNLPTAIDSDGTFLYVHNDSNTMLRFPIGGGAPFALGTTAGVSAIRVLGGTVFFTDYANNLVGSIPTSGGSMTTVASGGTGLVDLAVDGSYVYFIDLANPGSSVRRAGILGGPTKTYYNGGGSIGIEVDASYVYWITYVSLNQGKVMRAPK